MPVGADPLAPFSRPVREWFASSFEAPTDAQARGWEAIAAGHNTLIHAPTGSGKTLAAFLWALDRLATDPTPERTRANPGTVRVLYISPLKALTYDVERNLRAPLTGIGHAAQRLGEEPPRITVASRTGDTPSGATLIDDTYNANPESMRAAIDVLAACPAPTILVLGDMGELGSRSAEFHRDVGAYARHQNISSLLAIGDATREAVAAFGAAGAHASSLDDLLSMVRASATPQATLLVKGSRFMRMERVVADLTGEAEAH